VVVGIAECLRACIADCDPRLLDAEFAAAAVRCSMRFSPSVCAAYLECRAGGEERRVDLLVCSIDSASPFLDDGRDDGGSDLARRIQEARRNDDGALNGVVPLLWLEYDDVGNAVGTLEPSICVCIEPQYLDYATTAASSPDTWHRTVDAIDGLGMFSESEAGAAAALHTWVDALPSSGAPIHVSVMRGRPSAPVKLYLRVGAADAARYLTRIGWHGRHEGAERVFAWQAQRVTDVYLDLTLEQGEPAPRLGLAFPCPRRGTRFQRDVLWELGACVLPPDELEDVWRAGMRWVDGTSALACAGEWPWILHRWIDQKLVLDHTATQLKLYLGCRPMPLLIGAGRQVDARSGARAC